MPFNLADGGSLLVFAVVFFAVMAIGAAFLKSDKPRRKYRSKRSGRPDLQVVTRRGEDEALVTASEQLRKVMAAEFKPRPLLNRPEAQVFEALDKAVIARNPKWQVMAQVSLGEFLSSRDKGAFLSINSKRVDFALMDEKCCVRHALEYQGTGHHQGSAAARDAVKKEALRKAGIGYHEIVAGHTTPSELRALVEKLVPASKSAA
ncbi:DUF2726 domain-containing protein [Aurantiacibacter hainanensis]|uniref:DUF2726 domain-containing protein n=1 Tax=Aurantiacibacter hainanensis TaxID=3076114 RepID=UPI0030C66585